MPDIRFSTHPDHAKTFDTKALRDHYLIQHIFQADEITSTYTMHDRMIVLGIQPVKKSLTLPVFNDLTKADYFLQRRELGIINIGGAGTVSVDGTDYALDTRECLYIGRGSKEITFSSNASDQPADFYVNSCPAHADHPTKKAALSDANRVDLGTQDNCNKRVIYQFIHEGGIQSCQLVMGFTELLPGNIWNTFPPHTHLRRMEVYCYFDLPEDQLVMHFMGQPEETRHLVMRNKEAVISPEWSIHSGAATAAYSFVWGMGGENQAFTDMDGAPLDSIK